MTELALMLLTICRRDIVPFVLLRNGVKRRKGRREERKERRTGKE